MKCLQCGRCCFYLVIAIHPEFVKDVLDINTLPDEAYLCLDGSRKCPHLSWDNEQAICAIHHYSWFKDTPCGQFTQEIEKSEDTPCRTGVWMRENPDTWKSLTMRK